MTTLSQDESMSEDVALPKISVITVVLNAKDALETTIDSILGTEYPNIDYIIIDGCSTDGTVDMIKKYSHKLSAWISEKDSGIYDAMNKGWSLAAADSFVMFLGAGDRLISLPEDMSSYQPGDVVYGDVYLGREVLFTAQSGWRLKIYNSLHHQALLINRSCHPAPPFDLQYRVYADFDFNQRLMKMGARFCYVKEFRAVASPGGISARMHLGESLRIIRKNFGLFWSLLALGGFVAVRAVPGVNRLKPVVTLLPTDGTDD